MSPDILMDSFERTEYSDEIHGILGRALVYCCRFEGLCKSVSMLQHLKFDPQTFESKSDYEKIIRKIYSKTLQKAIESIFPGAIEPEVFERARKARNKIAHESSLGFDRCLDQLPKEDVASTIENLKLMVTAIAEADYILSLIASVQTHEPLPTFKSDRYVAKVLKWVFEP